VAAPATSYDVHRQRTLAAGLPAISATIVAMVLIYVAFDHLRAANEGQYISYGLELVIPLLALVLVRGPLAPHVEGLALCTDLAFTLVLVGRLALPTTTESGTALFLSLKLLATAVLLPWRPWMQYGSAAATLLLYYGAIAWTGRSLTTTHQVVGPVIAAFLASFGAASADRMRRALWRQSVDLGASEQRMRGLLETERMLTAIARQLSVLTELHTALDRVNQMTAAALRCEFSTTYLVDGSRNEIAAAATNAADPSVREQILSIRRSVHVPLMRRLMHGHTVVINDPAAQPWIDPADLAARGVRHLALAPIVAKGATLGVLSVTRTTTAAPFDERQIALLEAIAAQAAVAIENARLFDGLAASEARYRDLSERATDLILVIEEEGPVRFANRAALDLLAIAPERLGRLRWQDVVRGPVRRMIHRRMSLGRRRRVDPASAFEIDVQLPSGATASLEVRTRLISPPGQPRAHHCIARDVTERRRQERQTQELLHQLREANRLQSEFVANMSHELRTPLNVIIGYADLLADDPAVSAQSDAHTFLHRIAAAGRALHRLVESVLEYARLDRGRHVVIAKHFAAVKLLGELRDLCDDVSVNPDVELAIQATSDIAFATDYDRLYSILSNLLLNAMKFTAAGVVELRVERVGAEAEFTVRDTGIGIAPDALPHVFEPFRQVDGSPTRAYGGVGLGLAIVRRNTELLQGRVDVESQPGVGTTFRVRVPIALDNRAAAAA
jgi:PAS domain S-box-containing protein